MAPREVSKATPKVQRTVTKTNTMKKPSVPCCSASASTTEKTTPIENTTATPARGSRLRTNTVPTVATPKPKENRSVPLPSSMSKTAKKLKKRGPKPAHSGVPVPEKMKKLLIKELLECQF